MCSNLAAVRKNPSTSRATDYETTGMIKRYFQLAGDRHGGRKAREEKKKLKILDRQNPIN